MDKRLAECQRVVGYHFANPKLLEIALTHSSLRTPDRECNERLEFLGDSVLGLVITEELYRLLPDQAEGELTRIKSAVVSRGALYRASTTLGLARFAEFARGVGRRNELPVSVIANLVESVIGAIYLDTGYFPSREFILRHLGAELDDTLNDRGAKNYKSLLQHEAQQGFNATPNYRMLDQEGPHHRKQFTVAAIIGGQEWGRGSGATKKEAEQEAARKALAAWQRRGRGRRRRGGKPAGTAPARTERSRRPDSEAPPRAERPRRTEGEASPRSERPRRADGEAPSRRRRSRGRDADEAAAAKAAPRPRREPREAREPREPREPREARERPAPREPREARERPAPREPRERPAPREPRRPRPEKAEPRETPLVDDFAAGLDEAMPRRPSPRVDREAQAASGETAGKPVRRRRARRTEEPAPPAPPAPTEEVVAAAPPGDEAVREKPLRKRRTTRKKAEVEPEAAETAAAPAEGPVRKKRAPRKKKVAEPAPAPAPDAAPAPERKADAMAEEGPPPKKKRATRSRKKVVAEAPPDDGFAEGIPAPAKPKAKKKAKKKAAAKPERKVTARRKAPAKKAPPPSDESGFDSGL